MKFRVAHRTGVALLLSLLALMFTSCESNSRCAVEGEVSLDGEPIDQGSIVFRPLDEDTIKTGGSIVDGRYQVPAEKGPPPGTHKVLIFWDKKTGKKFTDETGEEYDRRSEAMPEIYRGDETPLEVEITSGKNVHDFHLKAH